MPGETVSGVPMPIFVEARRFQLLHVLLYYKGSPPHQQNTKATGEPSGCPGMRSELPHCSASSLLLLPSLVLEVSPVATNAHESLNLLEGQMFLIQSKFSFPFCSQLGILSEVLAGPLSSPPTVVSS